MLVAFGAAALTPSVHAQRTAPSTLLGGGFSAPAPALDLDPRLPTGARVESEPRPTGLAHVSCGLREPVCVHHDASVDAELAGAYLTALETAHAQLVGALSLPPPLPDPGLGPTSGLDLYLSPEQPADFFVVPDPRWQALESTSGHCRARPSHAQYRRQAGWCVAEALLLGVDAGETPHLRRALAAYLWSALGHASLAELEAIDTVQANPHLGLAGRDLEPESAGASLLFHHLDRHLRAGTIGALPVALGMLSRGSTPLGAPRWNNEPDAIDVLRQAFDGGRESFHDFMLDFAVERAFLGSRDAGPSHPELLWLGDAAPVRFEWALTASSLPRRVAPLRPLEPFGTAYVWLTLDRVSISGTLAVRADWEPPATFRWAALALDRAGRVLRRYDLPYVQSKSSAERTIVGHADASALLIAGINLGGVDLAHPFDPDHAPHEPHGFTVYVAEL